MVNTVYEGFTMDYTGTIQWAMREDGKWFSRIQSKGPYGYQWSKWRRSAGPSERARPVERRVRLPKGEM